MGSPQPAGAARTPPPLYQRGQRAASRRHSPGGSRDTERSACVSTSPECGALTLQVRVASPSPHSACAAVRSAARRHTNTARAPRWRCRAYRSLCRSARTPGDNWRSRGSVVACAPRSPPRYLSWATRALFPAAQRARHADRAVGRPTAGAAPRPRVRDRLADPPQGSDDGWRPRLAGLPLPGSCPESSPYPPARPRLPGSP